MIFATALITTDLPSGEQWDEQGLVHAAGRPLSDRLCQLLQGDIQGIGPPGMWAAAGYEFGGYRNRQQVWFHVGASGEEQEGTPVYYISVSVHLGWFVGTKRKKAALAEICALIDHALRADPQIRLLKWQLNEDRWFGSPIVRDWDLGALT